ncbi:hypothetical protein ONE63_010947 [Megalurothrips usitatus]|uniref:Ubiquitin-like protease family profile domain-containing protein n=1 Tax=Megalurothrips usitatus TaxID=439358 RepID=A0AAV7XI34_9NEOP|nr:hypothetical protein ONE63_010947 [Megalurothrips usitatus]
MLICALWFSHFRAPTQLLRSPVDSRIPKELSIPSKDETSSKRINIPVERSHGNEPSTSASRQQFEDPDLQYLGQVHTPRVAQQLYGEDVLNDILLKYKKIDEMKAEAEEREKEIKLIEERNRQAEIAHKKKISMELSEQLQMYLKVTEEFQEPEEEEPKLPELTDEMQAEIDKALSAPQNAVLSTGFSLSIKGSDMRTLRPLTWLNDEVINFYMNLLIERGKQDNYPSVYAFNTFFLPQLLSKGYDSLKRWTKKVDVFAHDFVLVPVHRGMHWCMAIIDMKEKVIRYYDSLDGPFPQCADALLNYLQKESMDKKKQPFDTTGWIKEHAENIPHQNNGSDCGMFACMYAEYASRGAPITFTQEHMPYFRRKVVYEILKRKLLT